MLDPELRSWMLKGYVKLGDIGYSIALNMRKNKNNTVSQKNLYIQGIKVYSILDILFRHVTFDDITFVPTLYRIEEVQVNKLVQCLIKVGELDRLPAAPSLYPTSKPIVITTGAKGDQGDPGANGTDANIEVEPKPGELQIKVTETVVSGVKTYQLGFTPYNKALLSAVIQGSKVFEIGVEASFNILLTSTKGSENLVSLLCTEGTIDTTLQGLLNLVTANDAGSQPYQVSVPITNQEVTETFVFRSNDNVNEVSAQDIVSFYYPYLYGASPVTNPTHYTALTKNIDGKANKSFPFNDTDKYFYICYPSSYGTLNKIIDQNGFDITASFTTSLANFTSTGLDNNWTVEYRIYRTTLKTSINGTYSIQF